MSTETATSPFRVVESSLPSNNPQTNDYQGWVLIESTRPPEEASKAIVELNSMAARHFALSFAAQHGLTSPGVNGFASPMACDIDGKQITNPKTQTIHSYRLKINVARGAR